MTKMVSDNNQLYLKFQFQKANAEKVMPKLYIHNPLSVHVYIRKFGYPLVVSTRDSHSHAHTIRIYIDTSPHFNIHWSAKVVNQPFNIFPSLSV